MCGDKNLNNSIIYILWGGGTWGFLMVVGRGDEGIKNNEG